MKTPRLLLAMFVIHGGMTPAAPPKTSAKPPAAGHAAPSKSAADQKPAATKSTSRTSKKPAKSKRASTTNQTAPAPDRIREIQVALNRNGFAIEESGKLDAATEEALKRFQEQQKLPATGKLSSLTLIGLGLGPSQGAPGSLPDASGAKERNP